jgi:hypothetical protein
MATGNKHLGYKEALNAIEVQSPGAKHTFYFGFLARASGRFTGQAEAEQAELGRCLTCGSPTTGEQCAFCKLVERAGGAVPGDHRRDPAPESVAVELGATRRISEGTAK